jgi:cupin domain
MTLEAQNISTGVKRTFDHGDMNIVALAGTTIVRAVFNPGWRWSSDVKPEAGTESCQAAHAGIVLSGRFTVRMDDGTEAELGPGDAHVVGPGHDAWVVGDEPCVLIDIAPATPTAGAGAKAASCPCGVQFSAPEASLEHLIAAIQQHAGGSHGHDVSREHILGELVPA